MSTSTAVVVRPAVVRVRALLMAGNALSFGALARPDPLFSPLSMWASASAGRERLLTSRAACGVNLVGCQQWEREQSYKLTLTLLNEINHVQIPIVADALRDERLREFWVQDVRSRALPHPGWSGSFVPAGAGL